MNLEKEFIPYEQALALKELGFDEKCLAFYNLFIDKNPTIPTIQFQESVKVDDCYWIKNSGSNTSCPDSYIAAPLYQQAFRWFREKYGLFPQINLHDRENEETWRITISVLGIYDLAYNQNVSKEPYYKTYEEAELACLVKLIEICQKK